MLRWWYDPGWRIVLELSILSMQYMNKIVKFNSNKKKTGFHQDGLALNHYH